jgi:catalase
MRQTINKGNVSYHPNTLGGGCPFQAKMAEGGFSSYAEKIDAKKVRERSASFFDHFSQATLFFNSQSDEEKSHIVNAFTFELGKVETVAIRERMLGILAQVDTGLANEIAYGLGAHVPKHIQQLNFGVPADADVKKYQPVKMKSSVDRSEALSMANTIKNSIRTRKIAILAADGVDAKTLTAVKKALVAEGAAAEVIAPKLGVITAEDGTEIHVDKSFLTTASVLYDAVYVPGGKNSVASLEGEPDAIHFLNEAYKHCKAIAADEGALQVLEATYFRKKLQDDEGVIVSNDTKKLSALFIGAIAQHRFWQREKPKKVPA